MTKIFHNLSICPAAAQNIRTRIFLIKTERLIITFILVLVSVLALTNIVYADSPGDLDTSFGLNGKTVTDFGEAEQP